VHKATHHFDLVNWWIDAYPRDVFALAGLGFYGRTNAEARGESYPYARYTGNEAARDDPFALFLDRSAAFRGLYLEAEAESGYVRDRNVFGEPMMEVHRGFKNIGRAIYTKNSSRTPEQVKKIVEILQRAASEIDSV